MTDFRVLLEDLVEEVIDANQYMPPGVQSAIERARAALAEPQPEGPSGDEIYKLALEGDFLVDVGDGFTCMVQDEIEFARAVLARWGNS